MEFSNRLSLIEYERKIVPELLEAFFQRAGNGEGDAAGDEEIDEPFEIADGDALAFDGGGARVRACLNCFEIAHVVIVSKRQADAG